MRHAGHTRSPGSAVQTRTGLYGCQAPAAVITLLVCLTARVADERVDHEVVRLHAVAHEALEAAEQHALVAELVPRGVDPALVHVVGAVVDARDRARRFVAEHADVDALHERNAESAGTDFGDPSAPVWPAKEVVVEQQQLARPRLAAPDLRDRPVRASAALLARHDAEVALEATAAHREADRRPELRVV